MNNHIQQELFLAMDEFVSIAEILINKVITETIQPQKEKIIEGHYYEIEDAELLNGKETLSDDWWFEVHGEHCFFRNTKTNQELEVYLGNRESSGNLDPQFFYNFLKTTEKFNHLSKYFENPFQDMIAFFEKMVAAQKMIPVGGVNFRKLKL
mgnify:CR=1 FL=1